MKKDIVSVPFIAFEKEMEHKNSIIKIMSIFIFTLIIVLIVEFVMFMSFIDKHNYTSYSQDGSGQNNINTGTQGDVINESTIENND